MGSGSEDLVLIQYYYSIHNMDLNYLAGEPFRLRGSGPVNPIRDPMLYRYIKYDGHVPWRPKSTRDISHPQSTTYTAVMAETSSLSPYVVDVGAILTNL